VVWERYDGTRSVVDADFLPAGAPPGPPYTLADSANAFAPDVAPAGDGQFLVTWYRSDGSSSQVRAALWSASGFGPPQTLSATGAWAQDSRVAASPDGAAIVTWRRRTDGGFANEAVARSSGGAFGARETLSGTGESTSPPEVAVGPGGAAIAAWRERVGRVWRVAGATRAASGQFGPAAVLSAPGSGIYGPAVAAGPDGLEAVAWSRGDGNAYRVEATTRQAGGPFGAAQVLSSPAGSHYGPVAAVGPDGETVIAWYATEAGGNYSVQAASRPAGGAFGSALRLSEPAENALEPRVAGSPKALALIWTGFEGTAPAVRESGVAAVTTGGPGEPPSTGQQAAPPSFDLRTPVGPIALIDRVAPRITYFAVTPRFAAVPRRARVSQRVPVGGRLRFGLSEAGSVTVAISGHRGAAEGAIGPRYARAGANVLRFSGRLGLRALPRGRHRATIVAVDAAGNRSARRSDTFMISKRARKR
jgi:hypothetical protein